MTGGSSSAMAQSSAAGKNGDEGAPARDRRREVGEKFHGVTVKLTKGLGWSEEVCGGRLAAYKGRWSRRKRCGGGWPVIGTGPCYL